MGCPTGGRVATGIREHQGEHQFTQRSQQGIIAVDRVEAKEPGAGSAPLQSRRAAGVFHGAAILRLRNGNVLNVALR
jgi:hypothetical protein